MGAFDDARDKDLPDPGFDSFSHRMAPTIPTVKIADNADSLGVGRPDGKSCACVPVDFGQVSAQFFVDVVVVALLVQVHVKLTENRAVGVRVTNLEGLSGPGRDLQEIVECFRHPGQRALQTSLRLRCGSLENGALGDADRSPPTLWRRVEKRVQPKGHRSCANRGRQTDHHVRR